MAYLSKAECEILSAIDLLEEFPLSETQQKLVNYLRANSDHIVEALTDEDGNLL